MLHATKVVRLHPDTKEVFDEWVGAGRTADRAIREMLESEGYIHE